MHWRLPVPHPVKRARAKNPKPKTCRHCGQVYTTAPNSPSFQVWFSADCGISIPRQRQDKARIKAQAKKAAQARAEHRVRKEALKPRSRWLHEAQGAVNAYVRERDSGMPCISCGNTPAASASLTGHKMDCGHYRSRGAAPHLRFRLDNMAAQCVKCNRELSGNTVEFLRAPAFAVVTDSTPEFGWFYPLKLSLP